MSEKASVPSVEVLLQQAMARLQAREFHAAAPLRLEVIRRKFAIILARPYVFRAIPQAPKPLFGKRSGNARLMCALLPIWQHCFCQSAPMRRLRFLLLYLPPAREKRCTAPPRRFGKMPLGQIRRFTIWKRC